MICDVCALVKSESVEAASYCPDCKAYLCEFHLNASPLSKGFFERGIAWFRRDVLGQSTPNQENL